MGQTELSHVATPQLLAVLGDVAFGYTTTFQQNLHITERERKPLVEARCLFSNGFADL